MWPILREMRRSLPPGVALAAQPAAFRTSDKKPYFTGMPEFPDALESLQIPRQAFTEFGRKAKDQGVQYLGGCCGCNAAYIRAMAKGLANI